MVFSFPWRLYGRRCRHPRYPPVSVPEKDIPWWTPSNRNVPFCGLDVVYSTFHQFQNSFLALRGLPAGVPVSPRVEPVRGTRYTGARDDRDRRKPGGRRGADPADTL